MPLVLMRTGGFTYSLVPLKKNDCLHPLVLSLQKQVLRCLIAREQGKVRKVDHLTTSTEL